MAPDVALRIPPRPEMVLGAGSIAQLPALVRRLGAAEAFVVTDRGVVAAGIAGRVMRHFVAEGVPAAVFDGVGANPSAADVAAGVEQLRGIGARPVAVVALGGGSAIDAAKAIALQSVNDRPLDRLDDRAGDLVPAPPLIGVPTTAGTGSETNAFGVIDDPAARRKRYVGHASTMPRVAVLDPALSVTAPPAVTAACGIDVLAHAVESLQARDGNAYAAGLALEAVRLVFDHLPAVVADGRDLPGRTAMLLAAHIAGLAFATTGLGTAHAVGHALSARHGTAQASRCPRCCRTWWRSTPSSARTRLRASPRRRASRAAGWALRPHRRAPAARRAPARTARPRRGAGGASVAGRGGPRRRGGAQRASSAVALGARAAARSGLLAPYAPMQVWCSRFAAITHGMRRGDAQLGRSGSAAVRRGPSAGRVVACCLAAAVSLAACGDAEEPRTRPSTAAATATATAKAKARATQSAEAVVRGWADDLRRGDVDAATARFAVPAVVSNNSPEIRLSSRRDVRGFNASLPCGGRVTKITEHHGVLLATLVLTDRPGGDCGSGVGGVVQTAFEVRRGLIVRWLRLPDADAAPPPPGSSEA